MNKRNLICCLLILQALISFAQDKNEIVLATYTYSTNNRVENLQAMARALQPSFKENIIVRSYPTIERLIKAIANDSVDFAMINTSGYLLLQHDYYGKANPIVNFALDPAKTVNYGTCLITAANRSESSLSDFKKSINVNLALVIPSSTSGNLFPRLLLNKEGIRQQEFQVYYAGTHKKVVDDVISNKAQIGGCSCEEVQKANASQIKLKVLSQFDNIPVGPIIVSKKLTLQIIEKLKDSLLNMHTSHPEQFRKFCEGWTEFKTATNFKVVEDSFYKPIRSMLGSDQALWDLLKQ